MISDNFYLLERKITRLFAAADVLYYANVKGKVIKQRFISVFNERQYQEVRRLYQELEQAHNDASVPLFTQSSKVPCFPEEYGQISHFKITSDDAFSVHTFELKEPVVLFSLSVENKTDFEFTSTVIKTKKEYEQLLKSPITEKKIYRLDGRTLKAVYLTVKSNVILKAANTPARSHRVRLRTPSGHQLTLACHYENGKMQRYPLFRVAITQHYPVVDLTTVPRKKRADCGANRIPIIIKGKFLLEDYWIVKK